MKKQELNNWFTTVKDTLETAYLQHTEPWRQSGFSGPEARWVACRKPVADCMEKSGTFLDIGCANGYLLECVMKWTAERGLKIVPYGLDLSQKLINLAKQRLPGFVDNLFAGNGWDWNNPVRFTYVRTELVYVPEALQEQYVKQIMKLYLEDGGELLVAEYRSRNQPAGQKWVEQVLTNSVSGIVKAGQPSPIDEALKQWGFNVRKVVSGFWEGKELTRVAVVKKTYLN